MHVKGLILGLVLGAWGIALADPPPTPLGIVQVFSPDELLIIDSYPTFMEADIIQQLANGEDVPMMGTNVPTSRVTGEPLALKSMGKRSVVVPEAVKALPGYTDGATWRMRYTSASTNYYLVTAPAPSIICPVPPTPYFEFGIDMMIKTNLLSTNWVAEVVEVKTEATEPEKYFKLPETK